MSSGANGLLNINLPRLQNSIVYAGDYKNTNGSLTVGITAKFCVTNFEFTDWQGNVHPFVITLDCNLQTDFSVPYVPSTIADATDGSFYRIDITNPADPKVISKGGAVYHFPPLQNPWTGAHIPSTQPCCYSASSYENYYDYRFTQMTDTNGNSVFLSGSAQSYALTDTLGRQYTITPSGISYKDSNGSSQQIAVNISNTGSSVANIFSVACTYNGPIPNLQNQSAGCTVTPTPGTTSSQASIALPASDANGDKRTMTLNFDQQGRVIKIIYPTGGYTRYDYSEGTVQSWSALNTIYYPCLLYTSDAADE